MATLQTIASISATVAGHNSKFSQILKGNEQDASGETGSDAERDKELTWDNDWGWEDDKMEVDETSDTIDWSKDGILYSLSPLADIFVIASQNALVCLRRDLGGNEVSYQLLFDHFETESPSVGEITSILCLPLATHKQSLQGAPEWTCIIVGHSTGHVTFLTESGDRVLSQFFHNSPVRCFKYNSYRNAAHFNDRDSQEELSILYEDVLVIVDGQSLHQSLKLCRTQLARSGSSSAQQQQQQQQQHQQLTFKKWSLRDQKGFVDHVNIGLVRTSQFDQLVTASLVGGPYATIRPNPPVYSVYATAGHSPFVGFFYASEDQWQPLLSNASELAYAVASKVKTALFSAATSWFTGAAQQQQQQQQQLMMDEADPKRRKVEPATQLPLRYGLMDKRRRAVAIAICPRAKYCATVDAFGRVLLICLDDGLILRLWKGYRGAQIGWVSASDGDNNSNKGTALFLVIYASRRGLLEIWTACHGPRVAAFNVTKQGQLLYCPHSLIGLNSLNARHYHTGQCYFLDSNRSIKSIIIPYHLAYTDSNSYQTHDASLLKRLRQSVKEDDLDSVEIADQLCLQLGQFKLVSFLQQALDRLINAKGVSQRTLDACLRHAQQLLTTPSALPGSPLPERQKLIAFVACELELLNMHTLVLALGDHLHQQVGMLQDADSSQQQQEQQQQQKKQQQQQEQTELLLMPQCISGEIADTMISILHQLRKRQMSDKQHIRLHAPFSVSAFLNMFFCEIEKLADGKFSASVRFRENTTDEDKARLGEFLASSCLNGHVTIDDFLSIIHSDLIANSSVLIECIVCHLLSDWSTAMLNADWLSRYRQLLSNCLLLVNNERLSTVIGCLLATLQQSAQPPGALLLALLLLLHFEQHSEQQQQQQQLYHLTQKLKDVTALWLCLPSWEPLSERQLAEGNRGLAAELLARNLVANGCSSKQLEDYYLHQSADDDDTTAFSLAHSCWPITLQFDALAANCAWESALAWAKDPNSVGTNLVNCLAFLHQLGSGSGCLRQGLASMLWHVHFNKPLKQLAFAADKANGVNVTDRGMMKEAGMGVDCAAQFAACMVELLCDCIDATYADVVPALGVEQAWDNPSGRLSLCELALDQSSPVPEAVRQHIEVSRALHLILTLRLHTRLFSLFPSKLLFRSLTATKPPSTPQGHQHQAAAAGGGSSHADSVRASFLLLAVRAAAAAASSQSDSCLQCALSLSDDWSSAGDLPDRLRRAYVVELYASGRDSLAEQKLTTVANRKQLAIDLLPVIGSRLHSLDHDGQLSVLSIAVPSVAAWVQSCPLPAAEGSQQQQQQQQLELEERMQLIRALAVTVMNDIDDDADNDNGGDAYGLAVQINQLLACF